MEPTLVLLRDSLGRLISVQSALPPPSAPQLRHIPRSLIPTELSRLLSHQMLSLSHWLTVRQMQRRFRRHRKPQPLRWIWISRPAMGLLHPRLLTLMMPLQPRAKTPKRRQRAVHKAPGSVRYGACGGPKPAGPRLNSPPRPGQWPGAGCLFFQPLPLPPSRPPPRSMPRTAPYQ